MTDKAGVKMKLHEAIAQSLIDNGVDVLFGLIGDANLFMVDCFVKRHGGKFIAAANESGAVLMALGYAAASNKLGVATVTHGPALTNTVTALAEGVKAQLPLLLLCGDTPVADRDHLQNISQRDIIMPTGAGFEQARTPETLLYDMATALRRAVLERRPVALNMPLEFQWQDIVYQPVVAKFFDARGVAPSSADIDDAVGIIAAARQPIIVAGRGAIDADSKMALEKLAERTGALLATTLKAKGLFAGNDFDIGVFGTLSTPVTSDLIMRSDCVIAFGASLNQYTAAEGSFLKGKRVVQCNAQVEEIGKTFAPQAGIVGHPALVAERIMHWLDEAEIEPSGFRCEDIRRDLRNHDPLTGLRDTATENTVDLTRALLRINDVIARDRVFVTDGGRFVGQAWKIIDVAIPGSLVFTVHFGSIGLGMGYAIGAGEAAPGRPVLLVTGDGGFMLGGLAEFNTAVRHGTDLIVVLCNDGGYGAEYVQFAARNIDPGLSLLNWPDFAAVATALGGYGVTVRSGADLDRACEAIANRKGPLLVDLRLDPERMLPLDH